MPGTRTPAAPPTLPQGSPHVREEAVLRTPNPGVPAHGRCQPSTQHGVRTALPPPLPGGGTPPRPSCRALRAAGGHRPGEVPAQRPFMYGCMDTTVNRRRRQTNSFGSRRNPRRRAGHSLRLVTRPGIPGRIKIESINYRSPRQTPFVSRSEEAVPAHRRGTSPEQAGVGTDPAGPSPGCKRRPPADEWGPWGWWRERLPPKARRRGGSPRSQGGSRAHVHRLRIPARSASISDPNQPGPARWRNRTQPRGVCARARLSRGHGGSRARSPGNDGGATAPTATASTSSKTRDAPEAERAPGGEDTAATSREPRSHPSPAQPQR